MKVDVRIIAIAAAVALAFGYLAAEALSDRRIARLERSLLSAEARANENQRQAEAAEAQARTARDRIEVLEKGLAEIAGAAKEQDAQIESVENDINNVRRRLNDKRRVGTNRTTASELRAKLAELGHACR